MYSPDDLAQLRICDCSRSDGDPHQVDERVLHFLADDLMRGGVTAQAVARNVMRNGIFRHVLKQMAERLPLRDILHHNW
jgi:hypothetical protein